MYMCEELLCFFLCSVSFLFLSLCSVVYYARDCSCTCACLSGSMYMYRPQNREGLQIHAPLPYNVQCILPPRRKFTRTDPGYDRVGKTSKDGSPMTILDIARQGDQAFEGPVTYSFCTTCEVSPTLDIVEFQARVCFKCAFNVLHVHVYDQSKCGQVLAQL